SEMIGNQLGSGRDRRAIFNIHDQRHEIAAECGSQFVGIALLANGREYVPAGIDHSLDRSVTNAAGSTGDQDSFLLSFAHGKSSRFLMIERAGKKLRESRRKRADTNVRPAKPQ